jgi:hypothetical protein
MNALYRFAASRRSLALANRPEFILTASGVALRKVVRSETGGIDMTVRKIVIAPEYVSFYVAGKRKIVVPINHDHGGLAATDDCISVPALYWNEGDTNITIGPFEELNQLSAPDFDGLLNTPENKIMLSDANDIEDIAVPTIRTRIRIWLDHPTQPENVVIGWG